MARKKNRKKYIVDVETGSLNPEKGALCSVTFKEFSKRKKLNLFIKPNLKLEYEKQAMEINGLTKTFLRKNGVTEKQAIKKIKDFINNEQFEIIGQNIDFDIAFLNNLFKRNVKESFSDYVHYHKIDTMMIAKFLQMSKIFNFEKGFSLSAIYGSLIGGEIPKQHTSLGDVLATEKILKNMLSMINNINKGF